MLMRVLEANEGVQVALKRVLKRRNRQLRQFALTRERPVRRRLGLKRCHWRLSHVDSGGQRVRVVLRLSLDDCRQVLIVALQQGRRLARKGVISARDVKLALARLAGRHAVIQTRERAIAHQNPSASLTRC
jgi:hypothetical protein